MLIWERLSQLEDEKKRMKAEKKAARKGNATPAPTDVPAACEKVSVNLTDAVASLLEPQSLTVLFMCRLCVNNAAACAVLCCAARSVSQAQSEGQGDGRRRRDALVQGVHDRASAQRVRDVVLDVARMSLCVSRRFEYV
jgi:hypothetical protein